MVGLLRTPLRAQRPAFASCVSFRNITTTSSRLTLLHSSNLLRASHKQLLAPTPIRTLSLGSIFGSRKPTTSPPPQVVAQIAAAEAAADANPRDVEKQVALFEALLNTNAKAGYDVIISRWERVLSILRLMLLLQYMKVECVLLSRVEHLSFSDMFAQTNLALSFLIKEVLICKHIPEG